MKQSLQHFLAPSILYPFLLTSLLAGFYLGYLAPYNQMYTILTWDAFRDITVAQHLLAGGGLFADPVLDGYWFWYPPTNALVFSALSSLFNIDLFTFYALSPSIVNWLFVAAFFLFSRRLLHSDAFAFWTTLGLASLPWVVTYVIAFPTVMAHACAFGMVVFYLYIRWLDWKPYGRICISVITGLLGLYHPPTAIILIGSFVLHRLVERDIRESLVIGAVATAIPSPYLLIQLSGSIQNPDPIRYVSPAMFQPAMVLPGFLPLLSLVFFIFVCIGLLRVFQCWNESIIRLVCSLLLVGVIGQAPAYLLAGLERFFPEFHTHYAELIPILLPHEFQLYSQVALLLVAALGANALWQSRLLSNPMIRYTVFVLVIVWTGAMLVPLPKRVHAYCEPYRMQGEWRGVVEYINNHPGQVPVTSVICAPSDETSFFVTGLRTGRKSLATFASHMNPRADHAARTEARRLIMESGPFEEVARVCRDYTISYILVTRKKTSHEQIKLFQKSFETVYNDSNVYLFHTAD